MRRLNGLDWLFVILLVIGGINWGLVGLFNYDLVAAIFGAMSGITRIIYTAVGVAALYTLITVAAKQETPDTVRSREEEQAPAT